jgi:hypothetical protein
MRLRRRGWIIVAVILILLFLFSSWIFSGVDHFSLEAAAPRRFQSFDCLYSTFPGRFGNAFFSLLFALQVAKNVAASQIYWPRQQLALSRPIRTTEGIDIIPQPPPTDLNCLTGFYLYRFPYRPYYLRGQTLNFTLIKTFKKSLFDIFPNASFPSDGLVIQLRGGDIWVDRERRRLKPTTYGQPPLDYYLQLIKMRNWSRIEVISEDRRNPCLGALIDAGAHFQMRSLPEDLALMMHARNLVISRSTLGIAAAFLSPYLENLWTFNLSSPRLGEHWDCQPTDHYYQEICAHWRNRPVDVQMMMNSTCKGWKKVLTSDPDQMLFIDYA